MTQWLISARDLAHVRDDVRVLDARAGDAGRAAYHAGHVRGALHVDLDRDLAAPVANAADGGRHPLPGLAEWCARLGSWGITPNQPLVVYDDQGGAHAAARLWWMLRAVGHTQVRVLDGGLHAAQVAGLPIDASTPQIVPIAPYPALRWVLPTCTWRDVDAYRLDRTYRIVDVRAAGRYRGEFEPIDPVAGHIPGAINIPYSENLDSTGSFKAPDELRTLYRRALPNRVLTEPGQRVVVHCGSGVTACHTLLALAHAGLGDAILYVGSWSEWCRRDTLPRAVGSSPEAS